MTPAELRAWQVRMGYSLTTGAAALGIARSTFAVLLAGERSIDRRTALACAAIESGLIVGAGPPASVGTQE